jgi:hypothetical protein
MTQDFRQSGPTSIDGAALEPAKQTGPTPAMRAAGLPTPQALVLKVLYGSALVFLVLGIALLVAEQSFLPADISPFVAIAFILTAVSDLVAVKFLKAVWSRQGRAGR